MTESDAGCCRCCCSFIFTSGLTALFLWLSLRPNSPTCSIEDLSVFALNKTANSPKNHSVSFHLKLRNNNKDMGVYYDALNLTLFYKPPSSNKSDNSTPISIGSKILGGFYQGHQKKAHRYGMVEWQNVTTEAGTAAGTAAFRAELGTAVRYKIMFWKTKRYRVAVGADLAVNGEGGLVKRKGKYGIKMRSGVVKGCSCYRTQVGLISVLLWWWVL